MSEGLLVTRHPEQPPVTVSSRLEGNFMSASRQGFVSRLLLLSAIAVTGLGCKKTGQETPQPGEPGAPTNSAAPTNAVAGPGLPATPGPDAATSTQTPRLVEPLAPTPKEVEVNQAAAEEYYRSPQGASGSGGAPPSSR